jgi:hypothetical protein
MADPQLLALFIAQSLNDPAPEGELAEAERDLGRALPDGFRAFLAASNGYDDALGKGYLSLWPAGQLAPRNEGYEVARQIADVVLIGSNGGGTCYGIDWAGRAPHFISVPFAPMQRAELRVLGATFRDFVEAVERGDGS